MPDLHLLPGIWTPVKGYDPLLTRLRGRGYRDDASPPNLVAVGYDWRLSNRQTGKRIAAIVEPALQRWRTQGGRYADAKISSVCHSMGGLAARWYIEHGGGAEITGKLITLGTPYRGAAKALHQLVKGVHKGLGPLAADLTCFARSLPSLHQLLPEYACIERGGDLAKTTETSVPELDTAMIADAIRFHTQLNAAETARPASLAATHAIVGIRQPTPTTVRISHGRDIAIGTYRGEDLSGDATVPIVGASHAGVPLDSNTLHRIPDKHGNLQRNRAALDQLEGILTARPVAVRAPGTIDATVDMPELIIAGEPLPIQITLADQHRAAVRITVSSETGQLIEAHVIRPPHHTGIDDLPPGAYTVDVAGVGPASPITPVSSTVLVWDPDLSATS